MKTILSISGGGIKSMIPALILAEIEKRSGKRIAELFDLCVGTSGGGILALGLTAESPFGLPMYTAQELSELYFSRGSEIFSRSLKHKILSMYSLSEEKYPSAPIEKVLKEYFKNTRLKDALTNVMVTSYDLENRKPYFFKSWKAEEKEERDTYMWMAARATSAAPTFFEPFQMGSDRKKVMSLIDGGVFVNSPALCAYAEAKKIWPYEDVMVLSLGCGENCKAITHHEAKGFGLAKWARPILDIVFDGVGDATDYQLQALLGSNYTYIQPVLPESCTKLDNTSQENLEALKMVSQMVIQSRSYEIDEVIKKCLFTTTSEFPILKYEQMEA